jgi:hypothetical protein
VFDVLGEGGHLGAERGVKNIQVRGFTGGGSNVARTTLGVRGTGGAESQHAARQNCVPCQEMNDACQVAYLGEI